MIQDALVAVWLDVWGFVVKLLGVELFWALMATTAFVVWVMWLKSLREPAGASRCIPPPPARPAPLTPAAAMRLSGGRVVVPVPEHKPVGPSTCTRRKP